MIRIDYLPDNRITACGITIQQPKHKPTLSKLCRALIDAGYAAHDIALVYRGSTQIFTPTPLSYWAERDVSEGDHSIRWVKHRPFDKSVFG